MTLLGELLEREGKDVRRFKYTECSFGPRWGLRLNSVRLVYSGPEKGKALEGGGRREAEDNYTSRSKIWVSMTLWSGSATINMQITLVTDQVLSQTYPR